MIKKTDKGFEIFSKGRFENGGDNLYVNANGIIEKIHHFDVNNDGYADIILPNSHGYIERGPTWIYKQTEREFRSWERQELPNDSGWMTKIADIDGDGYPDIVVVNAENGVTSELESYIYWGGPGGLTGERTALPTAGAYDVALVDLNRDGLPDLIFPSAWVDHHNPGRQRLMTIYIQKEKRQFIDESESYGLYGTASMSIVCEDLNGDGFPDLVAANYRKEFDYETASYIFFGNKDGFDTKNPLILPTHYALQVITGDLNNDGRKEIIFFGGDEVWIYWNSNGGFDVKSRTIIKSSGVNTLFSIGTIRGAVGDVDGDGINELVLTSVDGVEIRSIANLNKVVTLLPIENPIWVTLSDLNNDGYPEIIASKYHDGITYETNSVIFWNDSGVFSPQRTTLIPTAGALGSTAGDINGDGIPEIIFNNTLQGLSQFYTGFPVYVYLGSKDFHYSTDRRLELPTGGSSNAYILSDLDLDGYPDLVITAEEGLRIFHGGPEGLKPDNYTVLPHVGNFFLNVFVADFNRDGWLDLFAAAYTYDDKPDTMAKSSIIYFGSKEGYSVDNSFVIPTYSASCAHLADVNNDGWLDIIYADSRGFIGIYLGGPDGFSTERMWKIPLEGTENSFFGSVNSADLNNDGWPDLVIGFMGHYARQQGGFYIIYGGPDGFSQDRIEFHPTDASPIRISIADVNKDGNLDLLVPTYSTQYSRELPSFIYWGKNKSFDFDNPVKIPCNACCAFMAVDITGNGYLDLLAICHRNDLGHQVDSLLFYNGPEGISYDNYERIPGLGPHATATRDFGNGMTREPLEIYTSPVHNLEGKVPVRISWDADVSEGAYLKFQLRWGENENKLNAAKWHGSSGEEDFYLVSGQEINFNGSAEGYFQYRVFFVFENSCSSLRLKNVEIYFN